MAQPKATYEAVAAAIEQIKAEGRSITVAAIQAITGGSNSTIVLLRRKYQAERPTVLAAMTIEVDPQINALIAADKQRAVDKAGAEASRKIAELENDLDRNAEESEERRVLLEIWEVELEAAKGQLQSLAGQIDQLKADAEQIREAHKHAQRELAKAELRLESLPRLEKETERLQAALDAERLVKTDAERREAVATAKAEGLAIALAGAEERERAALAAKAEAEKQSANSRQAEQTARIAEQAAQARLEAAAREIDAAKVSAAEARGEAKQAVNEAAELRGQLAKTEKTQAKK